MKVEQTTSNKQLGFIQQHTLTQSQRQALIEEKLERARLYAQNQRRVERRHQYAWIV